MQPAIFMRRYKRFLVDVIFPDGQRQTIYCPNTGRMTSCLRDGCDVLLSESSNPARKYKYTLELTKPSSSWVGVNTGRTNSLVAEALHKGIIKELDFTSLKAEIKVSDKSRLDFLLKNDDDSIYVEVKNCTLACDGVAMFPDAPTSRGSKHLGELMRLKEGGHRAVIFFCVQRQDVQSFSPADHIDRKYGDALRQAVQVGVEVLAYQANVRPDGVDIIRKIPIII